MKARRTARRQGLWRPWTAVAVELEQVNLDSRADAPSSSPHSLTWQELGAAHTNFDRNLIRKVYWLPRQRLAE